MHKSRGVRGLGWALGFGMFLCGCGEPTSPCFNRCSDPLLKDEIVRVAAATGATVDPATMCENETIRAAQTCDACIAAFQQAFGVSPVGSGFCE